MDQIMRLICIVDVQGFIFGDEFFPRELAMYDGKIKIVMKFIVILTRILSKEINLNFYINNIKFTVFHQRMY